MHPKYIRYVGLFIWFFGMMLLIGLTVSNAYPEWLNLNVFSMYSKFVKAKTFTIINNNQANEIAMLLYVIGACIYISTLTNNKNLFYKTAYYTMLVLLISFVIGICFIHGFGFIVLIVVLPFLAPVYFIIIFHVFNYKTAIQYDNKCVIS